MPFYPLRYIAEITVYTAIFAVFGLFISFSFSLGSMKVSLLMLFPMMFAGMSQGYKHARLGHPRPRDRQIWLAALAMGLFGAIALVAEKIVFEGLGLRVVELENDAQKVARFAEYGLWHIVIGTLISRITWGDGFKRWHRKQARLDKKKNLKDVFK